jgi:iron-sulfur cluster assembly protein|tara:strand:+ start:452 stop:772 length:321 start_codon:yes stop_codon:yes gene_type:complete
MIALSNTAQTQIKKLLDVRGKGIGLRLGVRTTGCSGMAYVLEFVDVIDSHDVVFESQGVSLIVDPKSLTYIDGIEVDYVRNGLNEGFEFINPIEKDRCGCGESFRV